jgi:hypothetical protein
MRRNQEVLQWRDLMVGDERDPGLSQLDIELPQVKFFYRCYVIFDTFIRVGYM